MSEHSSGLLSEVVDILVIEDNRPDAVLVAESLEREATFDVNLEYAERLEEGSRRFDHDSWDLLLVDLFLPDSGAEQTLDQIEAWTDAAPVIVMTGQRRPELERRALSCGVADFFPKGWLAEDLLARTVSRAVVHHRARRLLERYKLAVESASDPIIIKDLEGRYQLANESAVEIMGRSEERIIGKTDEELFDEETADHLRHRHELTIKRGEAVTEEEHLDLANGPRTYLTTQLPFKDGGEIAGTIGIARDITDLQQLEQQALYDHQTGLPSSNLFRDRLCKAVQQSKTTGGSLTVAVVDLDNFQVINQSLGRATGDTVLEKAAKRLQMAFGAEDTVGRLGGDEFTLLLESIESRAQLQQVAGLIEELFDSAFDANQTHLHVSASIGFAHQPASAISTEELEGTCDNLIQTANQAARKAKDTPDTSWQVLIPDRDRTYQSDIRVENEIRQGIVRRQFLPHFQPIYRLGDRGLRAVEILARWEHPERGMISPATFIPVAERTGLLQRITDRLLKVTCRHIEECQLPEAWGRPLPVNLNLSPSQVSHSAIADRLEERLDKHSTDLIDLRLEITEGELLERPDRIEQLRERGFQIVIDDFGTGFSSLSRIKELPMDELKLDMEFVQGAVDNQGDEAIVRTVVELGRQLDVPVIAEGVETEAQLELLDRLGCTAVQGYYFGKPAPFDELF